MQCAQSIAGNNLFEGIDNTMSADLDPISPASTCLTHRLPFDVSGSHRFLVDAESIRLLQEKFELGFGIASGPVFT
jgi:hypothetical protein